MHPNATFRSTPEALNIDFARDRGFGMLSVNAPDGPLLSHVPFLLSADGTRAELHLVRSNPICPLCSDSPQPCVIAVSGPDGYVSPDWYGVPDQVPTWNYVAVHLRGTLTALPHADLHPMLDRLSAHFEERLRPKAPWHSRKMSDSVMARMMRAIAPFRLDVTAIHSTWKLNQNKPDAVRLSAADRMEAYGIGSETALLSALMRGANDPPE